MISRATVVGAGVVGLAMARGLERLGCDVTVLERATAPRQDGAGLTLWPNALSALDTIDAGEEVRAIGEPVRRAMVLRDSGRPLTELPITALTQQYGPLFAVLRSDLTRTLAEGLHAPVHYGVDVTVVGGQALVDGRPPDTELLIGADGIESTVRRTFLRGVRPRASGQFAARGVARTGAATPVMITESWGRGLRFGMVGLQHGLTYWFAATGTREAAENLPDTFALWHAPIADVLAAPQLGGTPVLPLLELPKLRTWHNGLSTVLIGDAAHAMTPNLGQGAAQGLEDVAVLLAELQRLPLPQALIAYERRRKRRAEQMAARSRLVGTLAQGAHPMLAALRDGLAPLTPRNVMAHQLSAMLRG
ncbi:FAD-dependent monooxygenase [Tessaracoccus antarcticus]|uniref:FAD-dependent monooxygenase n=1 Tax=Tessaracoccus antarcticus TaxID=2479848 RepID=UPI0013148A24|nr:FAD-dependent monooxygenase [Tessaracoccus antarcticus]